ncbi:hypothetical protein FACS1894137_13850 [Spirochaetia bacterium]|nr:hypothetical protein FACS1894137_13850 [Spirochaetia bacterium]
MKNIKLILMGMLAILLTFGMGLSGCSSDGDDSPAGYSGGDEARHEDNLAEYGYTIIERQTIVPWEGEWYEYVGPGVFAVPTASGFITLSYRGLSASVYIQQDPDPSSATAQKVADLINNKLALIPEDYRPELRAFVRNSKSGGDEYLVISTPEASTDAFTISSATVGLLEKLFGVTATDYETFNPYGKGIDDGSVTYLYTAAREPQYDTWDFSVRAYPYSTVGTRLLVDGLNIGDYDGNGEYDGIPIASGSNKEEIARALADAYSQWIVDNDYTGLIRVKDLDGHVVTVETKTDEIPWPEIEGYDGFNAFGYHVFAAYSQPSLSQSDLGSAQETANIRDIGLNDTDGVLVGGRLTIGYPDADLGDVYDTILFDDKAQVGNVVIQNLLVNTRVQVDEEVTDTSSTDYPGSDTKKRLHFYKWIDDEGREFAVQTGTARRNGDDISVTLNDTEDWSSLRTYPSTTTTYTDDCWTIYVFGAPEQGLDARYHHTIASNVIIGGLRPGADPAYAVIDAGKNIGNKGGPGTSVQERIMAWITSGNPDITVGTVTYTVTSDSNKVVYTGGTTSGNGDVDITTDITGSSRNAQFGNGAHILLQATNSAPGISGIDVTVSNN